MPKNDMAKALDRSLDMLGDQSKKALLFHLTHNYKVPIEDCSLNDIEGALKEIFGEGASLVVASINSELRQKTR
jgi:sialic acid synthase SpsE